MEKTINLLWTGGWDSTFRLLDLVIVQKRKVQPYYIISQTRETWKLEVDTMNKIKQSVFDTYPFTTELILPTIYKKRDEIKPNQNITDIYNRLAQLGHLGDQHDYLSRYAEEIGACDLEMCIDTRSPGFFTTFVKPNLKEEWDGNAVNFGLVEHPSNPDLIFFKYFKFPIHQYTKRELSDIAKKNGFLNILKLTWFCHSPKNGKPCGVCSPCKVTLEHGMTERIPVTGRLRNFLWYTVKPPIKNCFKW